MVISQTIQAVSEDISIRVVGLRRFVTLCKIALYRNSLTYLLTHQILTNLQQTGVQTSSLLSLFNMCIKNKAMIITLQF